MQREIKFRAFIDGVMEYQLIKTIACEDGTEYSFTAFRVLGQNTVISLAKAIECHTVMQFTGLKDKNGKEIWEGDVVKWGHIDKRSEEHPHRIAIVEFKPDIQFRIINYKHTITGENIIFQYGCFAYQETNKYLEIIGDIYSNPELIKEV